jgi:hypothetical protein
MLKTQYASRFAIATLCSQQACELSCAPIQACS